MSEISVVIVVKNEERTIGQVIDSCAKISDDIIICDTGSTDNTKTIALSKACNVINIEWIGYGLTKNLANSNAKYEWILSLDGDEVLSKELQEAISTTKFISDSIYTINRITQLGHKWIKRSGWHPQHIPRLFEKDKVFWNDDAVHESLIFPPSFKVNRLVGLCLHYSFSDIEDFRNRLDKYAKLKAEMWYQKEKKPNIFKKIFAPSTRFVRDYLLLQGFRDGAQGLTIAIEEAKMLRKAIQHYNVISNKSNGPDIS
jgi:glycosyltransferase involved in cell wall biosynthesis